MKKLILFALSVILLLSGCFSDRTGNFQIYLTDQPIDNADEILVTVSEISVHKEKEGFLTVWQGERTYDLLKLRNVEKILVDTELEKGTYTQVRLVIRSGEIGINDNNYDLTIPSSEVKIPVIFNIMEDGATEIVLDFEAEHSVHVVNAGVSGMYILRPVIKVKEIRY